MKTAFSKFDKLESTPGLFPGQDSLKNHFLPKWNVFYVDDPTDYSILKEKENEITTKYVWLIKKGIEIYPSFPWYYMPNQLATFKFPYVFEKSREVKSYDLVRLVSRDAHWNRFIEIEEKYIAGHYSPYKGQEKFDIFYIGEDKTVHNNLIERGLKVQSVDTVEQAREQSFTDMFWIVYDDTVVRDTFKFSYKPDEWSYDTPHVFGNGDIDQLDGIMLLPKNYDISERELRHRFLIDKKEVRIMASNPRPYDCFEINNYYDYQSALQKSTTHLFWGYSNQIIINEDFKFDYYISHHSSDRKSNHAWLNGNKYNGVFLFSKNSPVTEKEIIFRELEHKIDHEEVASVPKDFERFNIDTYEQYKKALYNCESEMFWGIPDDVEVCEDFAFDLYFDHHNTYDRNINHVFLNNDTYDGIVLFSKNVLVSEKEIEHRFLIKKKEHEIVASNPKQYPIYTVNDYQDYLKAKKDCNFDMFWMVNDSFLPVDNFNWDFYISHHNQYERKINHVWKNGDFYDGISLTSKKLNISQREIDYRFFVTKKEYPEVGSRPKPYDIVFISNGEPNADDNFDLLSEKFPRAKRVMDIKGIHAAHKRAAELADTEMFWVVDGDAEIIDGFDFDYYVPAYDIDGKETVHVWRSYNPINGLVYGYGGVKLLPTALTRNLDESTTDMTTSISDKFKGIDEMSNTTAFNTDSFSAWRSGFRECAKLASRTIARQKDDETEFRLDAWCSKGDDKPFGKAAIAGAIAGKNFGEEHKDSPEELAKINDFNWLKDEFKKLYQQAG